MISDNEFHLIADENQRYIARYFEGLKDIIGLLMEDLQGEKFELAMFVYEQIEAGMPDIILLDEDSSIKDLERVFYDVDGNDDDDE